MGQKTRRIIRFLSIGLAVLLPIVGYTIKVLIPQAEAEIALEEANTLIDSTPRL